MSGSLKKAFESRRDYLKVKNEVKAKRIKLVMKKNNLWPEINFEGSVTRNGLDRHLEDAVKEISQENNPEYFLGLTITFPIENRSARSEYDKAKVEKAQALLDLKKAERKILIDIQDSIRECNIMRERAQRQKEVVELQDEKLSAELKRYNYGRSDTDTVIRYQDDLLLSKILYAQALFEYKKTLIDLALNENSLLDNYWQEVP